MRSLTHSRRRLLHEGLERRTLLTADPVITEILADNEQTLLDYDDDASSWIEITNEGTSQVDLNSWYLTDNAGNLDKWQFSSSTVLGPGDQIVVFASNKNFTAPGGEHHTNFRLDPDGEFLALVQPDGTTVASQFAPSYPPQFEDISYGISQQVIEHDLVNTGDTAAVLVPSDGSLGTTWTTHSFNDASWSDLPTGVGYASFVGNPTGADLNADYSLVSNAPSIMNNPSTNGLWRYYYVNGENSATGEGGTLSLVTGANSFSTIHQGIINFTDDTAGGFATFMYNTTGSTFTDPPATTWRAFDALAHPSETTSIVYEYTAPSTALYDIDVTFEKRQPQGIPFGDIDVHILLNGTSIFNETLGNGAGQTQKTFVQANTNLNQGDTLRFVVGHGVDASRDDSTYIGATITPVTAPFAGEIASDIKTEMEGLRSSAYLRLPFSVTDTSVLDELTLRMKYDDAFVAYINGTEVARSNFTGASAWNSVADSDRADIDAVTFHDIDISSHLNLLVNGSNNVLAIHGINDSINSDGFLVLPELLATDLGAIDTVYMSTPSPGAENGSGLPAIAPEPQFSVLSGPFTSDFSLTLASSDPTAEIRYTTDGTIPTDSSTLYTAPISINTTTQIRARSFNTGSLPSVVGSEAYLKLAADAQAFTSSLPLVVIENFGAGSIPIDIKEPAQMSIFEPIGGVTSLTSAPSIDTRIGIELRGSTTLNNPKQNFSIEAWDQENDDKNISPFGMPNEGDWILYAPYNFDRALIRNALMYELSNQAGRYAPRTRFVEVFQNTNGGELTMADYVGVYVFMERIERDNGRVDIEKLSSKYDTAPLIEGGYALKIDRLGPGEVGFTTNINSPQQTDVPTKFVYVEPKEDEISAAQANWIQTYLNDFESALYGGNFTDPVLGYQGFIDVASFIDHHLLNEISFNPDAYRLSGYMHKSRGGKLALGPIWDFDRTMAPDDDGRAANPTGTYMYTNYGWYGRLRQDANYLLQYADRWHELRAGPLSTANVHAVIDSMAAELGAAATRNFNRWPAVSPVSQGSQGHSATHQGEIDHVKNYLATRLSFLDSLYPTPPEFDLNGNLLNIEATHGATFAQTTIVSPSSSTRYFVPTDDSLSSLWTIGPFNDASWSTGTFGIGYENEGSDYDGLISTTVQPNPHGGNPGVCADCLSVLTRTTFSVANTNDIDDLILSVRYDDGFIAYINGVEVARENLSGATNTLVTYNQGATDHIDSEAVVAQEIDITQHKSAVINGSNVLAIQIVNRTADSSDLLLIPELINRDPNSMGATGDVYYTTDGSDPRNPDGNINTATATQFTADIPINVTTRVKARSFDGSEWSSIADETFLVTSPSAADLAITEINYNPHAPTAAELAIHAGLDNDDFEFLELENLSATTVSLLGVSLTNGVQVTFPSVTLAPGQRGVVVKDQAAFEIRYGSGLNVLGQFDGGSLSNAGERIVISDAMGGTLVDFSYDDNDPWPERADGNGGTLELISTAMPAPPYDKYYRWRGSTQLGGSPGSAGVEPAGIVINEVLAHSELPDVDAIELHNPTGNGIDVSGWYLSDSSTDFLKYEIPAATTIPAGGFLVLDENDFNPNPGVDPSFALSSSSGDDLWLVDPDGGGPGVLHFVDDVHFGATATGEALGRVPDATGRLVPVESTTLGSSNDDARIGPLVISEVNYHPTIPSAAALAIDPTITSDDLEFVEVYNPTGAAVDLTDWRVRGGVDFDFAAGTTIDAGETLVVTRFNPTNLANADRLNAFRAHYGIDATVPIVGGYTGGLNNGSERLALQRPDAPPPENPFITPRLYEDELVYDDLPPWPVAPDGSGSSLTRSSSVSYGNDAVSWTDALPTPGAFTDSILGDFNGDSLVNATDIDLLNAAINSASTDLQFDLDGGGTVGPEDVTFLVETLLGTTFGDSDLDGDVDTSDLTTAIIAFTGAGGAGQGWANGDTDGDGDVDTSDLTTAIINFTGAMAAEESSAASYSVDSLDGSFVFPALKDADRDTLATFSIASTDVVMRSTPDAYHSGETTASETAEISRRNLDGQPSRSNTKRLARGVFGEEINWLSGV